jgi:ferritin-like metal-binding protein YciE
MKGLLEEGEKAMEAFKDSDVLDAALIAAAQRVEHYEMAGYGCARTYAHLLGLQDQAELLQRTLDEEGDTDHKLTDLAETVVNIDALK